jgi:hypothetical protein
MYLRRALGSHIAHQMRVAAARRRLPASVFAPVHIPRDYGSARSSSPVRCTDCPWASWPHIFGFATSVPPSRVTPRQNPNAHACGAVYEFPLPKTKADRGGLAQHLDVEGAAMVAAEFERWADAERDPKTSM